MKKIDKNKRRLNVDKKSEEGAKLHICLQKSLVPVKKIQFGACFCYCKGRPISKSREALKTRRKLKLF